MVKVNNIVDGLSKAQVRMLGIVANIEWCKAIERGQKPHANRLKTNGIEFIELVEYMDLKHRLVIFGTDDYYEITGVLDPFKTYEEKIVC